MRIALVGNQNCGKTTLFNQLTGTNQKVGNWPGVTIERKEGTIIGTDHSIVDLPGIYSLSPYTQEEKITSEFVLEEKLDLIINVIDATSIERSLYLTTQLLELDTNVLVVLNMCDALEKKGLTINESTLSLELGASIVRISALKKQGIDQLLTLVNNKSYKNNNQKHIYEESIEEIIKDININSNNQRFIKVKMLENDIRYAHLITEDIKRKIEVEEERYGYEMEQIIPNQRYNYITRIKKESITQKLKSESITDKLDKVFLNKYLALPLFLVIMFLIYMLCVGIVGGFLSEKVGILFTNIISISSKWLESLNASSWAISLVCKGIITGVGAVLSFVPQLCILFLCISMLETSGYMSRIAFLLDNLFRRFGLNGKSLIPFIVGSGCTVPGIMTARTIEDENERNITIICTPFIPCSAKLPIIALFTGAFFDKYSGLVTFLLYVMAIIIILLSSTILKKYIFKTKNGAFISELPEYKIPSFKYVISDAFDKTISFIKRSGSIILLCSVIVWLLTSFTWKGYYIESKYTKIENVNLEEIINENNIIFNEETIVNFEIKDAIYVTFTNGSNKDTYKLNNITKNDIIQSEEKGKTLLLKNDGYDILYSYCYTIESSILAGIGNAFAWVFYPIIGSWSWGATVSSIQGLVAKEQVVSSMTIIAGLGEGKDIFNSDAFGFFNAASAFAFCVFNLFSAPCFGAIIAMKNELVSPKKVALALMFQIGLAWALSALCFLIGSIFI